MEGEVAPTPSAAAGAASPSSPSSPSPPLDSDFTPVGSPKDALDEVHILPSDEDHEHEHEHEHDHDHDDDHEEEHNHELGADPDHDPSLGPVVAVEDLKRKIIKQAEYYFSDENLPTDKYMISLLKKNKEGFVLEVYSFHRNRDVEGDELKQLWFILVNCIHVNAVPITIIASFRKMKKLSRDHSFIVAALRESSFLVVSADGKKVKRLNPFPFSKVKDTKLCTVLVENLPEDHSVDNIRRIFGEAGKIRNLSVRDPQVGDEPKRGKKVDIPISGKLHALVEYETVDAAEKAVATLNNEQDWRHGMRVKLLKQAGKYGNRRREWREPDAERNGTARPSTQSGDEENHHLNEHHDDTHDEEDVEHVSKEKNGQRVRNRGRSRRNKHHVNNGLGHGAPLHGLEHSKPPPGPKMPDGTRGFTMGRGRPAMPNQTPQMI
ncbi:hypothetical protein Tsubulata_020899 [Turnera subulata]|uniref:HTH La-type RNA-binding domain-containing protein n=1 Tax=Turnera subulata TaxID=218843 RepID=A0A9Q0FNR1_9ROSI|nr:hypothetical protein Tsubulata_020899 [Turnera subulata]